MNLYVSIWSVEPEFSLFLKKLKTSSDVDRVIIFAQYEWCYVNFPDFDEVVAICHDKNISLDIIIGTSEFTEPLHNVDDEKYKNVTVHHWPTFWISYFYHFNKKTEILSHSIDKHFCLLNGNAHAHRCLTMDLLSYHNLLDKGYISWYDFSSYLNYEFKYWSPEKLVIDDFSPNSQLVTIPDEYHKSFVNIVSESNMVPYFLTEKTVKPIFYKKPFLVISKEGFHTKFLSDLGFKLYDEIFDYSFDNVSDMESRINQIILQIKKFENCSYEELQLITDRIEDKLEFNRQKLLEYAQSVDNWPDIAKEIINDKSFDYDLDLINMYYDCINKRI